jgi:Carboxypeptidase regulatory-like domain/TonB dependent receptor
MISNIVSRRICCAVYNHVVIPSCLAVLLGAILVTFVLGQPVYAQVNSATVQGTVVDSSGAAVAGAQIKFELKDTVSTRSTVSNANGDFVLASLQPGTYTVTVVKDGFSTFKQTDFVLEVGQIASFDPALKVGSVSQLVEVSSDAAQIQTEDSTLGGVIRERTVVDLPLNGRMFTQLLQLEPGTVPVDVSQNNGKQPGFGSGSPIPAVNGGTNRSNLFFLDGIYASNPFFAGFSFSPSVDAIQEFKEQTHSDQAEFGGGTGAIVSTVTRSGTNNYHGSAFEFLRNTVFDARNTFAEDISGNPTRFAYIQNQFGGTFAGPIIKNKLFFFAYYEGGRQVQQLPSLYVVPTAAERSGDFSGLGPNKQPLPLIYDPLTYNPATQTEETFLAETGKNAIPSNRIDAQMQAFLNGTFPLPNYSSATNGNNYLSSTGNRGNQDQGSIRVDYVLSDKDILYGRYSQGHSTNTSPSALANQFVTGFTGFNTGGTWTHTFSPTLISSVTIGVSKLDIPQGIVYPVDEGELFTASGLGAGFTSNPGGTAGPQVPAANLNGGPYAGFWNGAGPIGPMTTGQISGSLEKIVGNHAVKFGGAWFKTWMYTNWNGNSDNFSPDSTWNAACQFAVTGSPTAIAECPGLTPDGSNLAAVAGGDPVASMLLSLPTSATRNLGNSGVSLRSTNGDLFAQDSWRISRKLTFNYGLRWDYISPITETRNRLPTYDVYTQTYLVPNGDVDLPSGTLPANVALSGRRSITNPHYADFSPKLGVAYAFNTKTVLRVGFGRVFDTYSQALQVAQQNRGAWPSGLSQNASSGNINNAGISTKPDGTGYSGQNPFFGDPVIPASPLPASGLAFEDVKWQPDSSWQYNLQVQRDIGAAGILSVGYVGSHTEHTTIYPAYNVALEPTATPCIPACVRPDTVLGGGANVLTSNGTSNYNALQVNLTRPFVHGLAYTASFTYSKNMAIGNCGDFYQSCIQNPYDLKNEYGPSGLNVPLIFTLSTLYELPFGKNQRWATSGVSAAVFGGWQLNTIIALRSGLPVNLLDNANGGDQANVGGGLQRGNIVSNPNSGAAHTVGDWFNSSAFAIPGIGNYGDAGLNALRGPDFKDVDFSVLRLFTFTEKVKLQFRAELFDLFNHPNYNNPNLSLDGGSFNQITSTVGGPGANRNVQFALKLLF